MTNFLSEYKWWIVGGIGAAVFAASLWHCSRRNKAFGGGSDFRHPWLFSKDHSKGYQGDPEHDAQSKIMNTVYYHKGMIERSQGIIDKTLTAARDQRWLDLQTLIGDDTARELLRRARPAFARQFDKKRFLKGKQV